MNLTRLLPVLALGLLPGAPARAVSPAIVSEGFIYELSLIHI